MKLLFVILGVLATTAAEKFFVPCSQRDPDLNTCFCERGNDALKIITMNGFSQYGIFRQNGKEHKSSALIKSPDLKLDLTDNIKGLGMDTIHLTSCIVDLKKRMMGYIANFVHICWNSKYVLKGIFMNENVNGTGNYTMCFENCEYSYFLNYDMEAKNGTDYAKITNDTMAYSCKGMNYNMDNLQGGNGRRGLPMLNHINNNWRTIENMMKPNINPIATKMNRDIFEKVFSNVPFSEIITP